MDPILDLIALIGSDNAPNDAQLTAARGELVSLLTAATEGPPDLDAARTLRHAIDQVDSELATRATARQRDLDEAAHLREGLVLSTGPGEGDEDEEADEDDEPAGTEFSDRDLASAVRATRSRISATAEPVHNSDVRVRAVGPAQGADLPADATLADVAILFNRHASAVRNGKQPLVRLERQYPESRVLSQNMQENTQLLSSLMEPRAIAAAGGICDPLPADFSHPICGERGRPIRDALPQFQASSGGVRFAPSATIADVEDGITYWPIETDEDPGVLGSGGEEKACLILTCEEEDVAKVDAVVACLQIGNFQARFNPQFWQSRLDLLMVAHDRIAEQTLYQQLTGSATAVTYGAGNGTIYAVLSAIDKAVAGLRSRHRLLGAVVRVVAPAWVRQALRADTASQRLGSSPAEALTVADAIIDSFFASRGVSPVWSPDLDVFGAQGAGALLSFPGADVELLIYPEGTYFFLDGGTLDLGTEIRDSTLNKTNDRQAFLETFEKGVFRGCEALEITVPVAELCICPDVVDAG